jgi:hypothetical protein
MAKESPPVKPLDDPDFIGAEAALRRASAKAVARDRAAGLEPVVRKLGKKPDLGYEDFRDFIETRPAETVANILN